MKKKMVIGASLVALILSVSLFAISVLAAVAQSFGINNKIEFDGIDDAIAFDMDAVITGTIDDGDERLSNTWHYNAELSNDTSLGWDIKGDLVFDEKDKTLEVGASNRVAINYSFTVTNNSETGKRIKLYFNNISVDINVLDTKVLNSSGQEVTEVIVGVDQTETIILTVMPIIRFNGAQACNFSLKFEPID